MSIKSSIYFIGLLLFSFSACKSVRINELDTVDLKHVSKKDLLGHISDDIASNYESVEIKKFSASYTDGEASNRFKGFLRYVPQEALMVSVSPAMGIEMFRLLAKQDSLGYIDRYNKSFYNGTYAFLKNSINVELNFDLFQFLISGNIQQLPMQFRPDRRFNFKRGDADLLLSKVLSVDGVELLLEFIYDGDLSLRRFNIHRLADGDFVSVQYLSYFQDTDKKFPKKMMLEANKGIGVIRFNVEHKSIVFDKDLNFPFSVSSKYKEIITL